MVKTGASLKKSGPGLVQKEPDHDPAGAKSKNGKPEALQENTSRDQVSANSKEAKPGVVQKEPNDDQDGAKSKKAKPGSVQEDESHVLKDDESPKKSRRLQINLPKMAMAAKSKVRYFLDYGLF